VERNKRGVAAGHLSEGRRVSNNWNGGRPSRDGVALANYLLYLGMQARPQVDARAVMDRALGLGGGG
jgi:hypothetical protein